MRNLWYWGPTLVWMGLIFFLSSRMSVEVSSVYAIQFLVFKSLHIIEFGMLTLLLYRSLKNTRGGEIWQNMYLAWLYAIAYAVTDEVHQMFIPTREGRMRDIGIDIVGITLVILILWKYIPTAPKRLKSWAKKLQLVS